MKKFLFVVGLIAVVALFVIPTPAQAKPKKKAKQFEEISIVQQAADTDLVPDLDAAKKKAKKK